MNFCFWKWHKLPVSMLSIEHINWHLIWNVKTVTYVVPLELANMDWLIGKTEPICPTCLHFFLWHNYPPPTPCWLELALPLHALPYVVPLEFDHAKSVVVFHRAVFWGSFSLWCTLMISRMDYILTVTCLQMIPRSFGKLLPQLNVNYSKTILIWWDKWSKAWHLRFNPIKCSVLPVGSRNIDRYPYNLGGTNLNYTDSEKDIGVIIHKSLSFEEHMSTQVNKANRILGLIRRTFTYLDKDTFLKLYKALVRPRLEFSNAVWSPFLVKDFTLIENVRRRATRLLPGFKAEDYTTRLRNLNLPTLVYRRLRGDMIEL